MFSPTYNKSMEMDSELIEIFTEELSELKLELAPIVEKIIANNQQPELFTDFAQIIDRVYGTAMTMGFNEIASYLGMVRNISRKCGTSKVPRAMPEVSKIVQNCFNNFDALKESIKGPDELKAFISNIILDIKRAKKIEDEIFAFSKTAETVLKK